MARGVPVFNTDGTLREWVGTCIDITDRKRAEEILREQAMVISSVSDAIFSTDASFVIKSWNKAAERIFGWGAEEVIGKSWKRIIQPHIFHIRRNDARTSNGTTNGEKASGTEK